MSQQPHYVQFFFQVADKGCELKDSALRDSARSILKLIPPDISTIERLQLLFGGSNNNGTLMNTSLPAPTVENTFFSQSPSHVLYNLEVSIVLVFLCVLLILVVIIIIFFKKKRLLLALFV